MGVIFHYCFLFLWLIIVSSCNTSSLEDFREEGRAIIRSLTKELQQIQTKNQLLEKTAFLENEFKKLALVMKRAEDYSLKHAQEEKLELTAVDHDASDQLRAELNRIYRIEGCRQIIEECQQKALKILR